MNDEITIDEDGTLSYPVWFKSGGMMVRRDCLDATHPQQTYNYLKSNGIKPEDYGIRNPRVLEREEEFSGKTRDQLIDEILKLRAEVVFSNRYL